jgi:hypothetical protein
MSDGTPALRFLDPDTLRETGRVIVKDGDKPIENLNEHERVKGEVFANVWLTDRIAIISPDSGRVTGWLDLAGIRGPVRSGTLPVWNTTSGCVSGCAAWSVMPLVSDKVTSALSGIGACGVIVSRVTDGVPGFENARLTGIWLPPLSSSTVDVLMVGSAISSLNLTRIVALSAARSCLHASTPGRTIGHPGLAIPVLSMSRRATPSFSGIETQRRPSGASASRIWSPRFRPSPLTGWTVVPVGGCWGDDADGAIEGSTGLADAVAGLEVAMSVALDGEGDGVALAQPAIAIVLMSMTAPSVRMRISFERHGDVRAALMLRPWRSRASWSKGARLQSARCGHQGGHTR